MDESCDCDTCVHNRLFKNHLHLVDATNNFTGVVPPSIFGVTIPEDLESYPSAPPEVTSSSTITVTLDWGDQGQTFIWTKEEAILIRDAINKELGVTPYVAYPVTHRINTSF